MKAITLLVSFIFILISCEKPNPQVNQNGNLGNENDSAVIGSFGQLHPNALLKTKYNFSSSTDTIPYTFIAYEYDEKHNLIRELLSDYPGPPSALSVYEYTDQCLLLNKKRIAMEGMNSKDQTEADFTLIYEEKYSYNGNIQTKNTYIRNKLEEIAEYSYTDGLLMSETHNYLTDRITWSMTYEYDQNKNKIKETSYPDSSINVYSYEGKTLKTKLQFDKYGALIVEMTYIYGNEGDKTIVQSNYKGPYGEYTFDKTIYQKGNMVEYIMYDNFKFGEWVSKFEYY